MGTQEINMDTASLGFSGPMGLGQDLYFPSYIAEVSALQTLLPNAASHTVLLSSPAGGERFDSWGLGNLLALLWISSCPAVLCCWHFVSLDDVFDFRSKGYTSLQ